MSRKPANLDPFVSRLEQKGYAVAFAHGFLLVRDVPYIDDAGTLQRGILAVKLKALSREEPAAYNHQAHFAGSMPHGADLRPLTDLSPQACEIQVDGCPEPLRFAFSNKPTSGTWANIFELIDHYANIIAGPAENRFHVSRFTGRTDMTEYKSDTFRYGDVLSSRADILDLSAKLRGQRVAVIGAGGTGAYLVDLLSRSSVRVIKIFDFDTFEVHNAFRAPGRLLEEDLGKNKAVLAAERYGNWRFGIEAIPEGVTGDNKDQLNDITFAFVCVDSGPARLEIATLLDSLGIPFIDVGIGIDRSDNGLHAAARVTLVRPGALSEHLEKGILPISEDGDDEYTQNIQTPEMNSINASMAVIKFKQYLQYYSDIAYKSHFIVDTLHLSLIGENYGG